MMADARNCSRVTGLDKAEAALAEEGKRWNACMNQRKWWKERDSEITLRYGASCDRKTRNGALNLQWQTLMQERERCMNLRGWKETTRTCPPDER